MIGDFALQIDRYEPVESGQVYRMLGMRSKIGGPFIRETKSGSEISAAKLNKVKAGDFIYSRLFAWQGSFGLVPEVMDGCYVSNEFPLYELDTSKVIPEYLVYWFGLPHVQKMVEADCSGSTPGTRNRFKEIFFERLDIELPSIEQQKSIVKSIQLLEQKRSAVIDLRSTVLADAQAMLSSAFHKIIEGAVYKPMSAVAPIVRRQIEITVDGEYPELGARSFGKGIFHKPTLIGAELDWQKLYTVHSGDLVLSNIKAWEGAIAAAGDKDHGRVGSHRYITCVPVEGVTTANFLAFYLLTQEGIEQVQAASPGSADRNRTLAMKRLEKIKVPVPDYDKQLWFNQLQSYVEKIKQAQSENATELEALMPSILDKAFKGELV
ncbi:restriction endonuclease subunit S [Salmonella enterica]|uniref:restriction endonuclease subunit S n=1 Tax=Vibrio cholerae TaxID=666 RepID=UPI000BA9BAAA|nr:restriction endonuclease subunit S [Vibrio cholerae]EBW2855892.1 restriction endonuclease subunit S [Salmonella enterica subsp. enterica serovar Haifa]ECP1359062.1 restriction endonuclease subunit S [Salmonella enterica]EDV6270492.1 restriction endonuclease subunit S [Salmonella enterica subsp. enterica]EBX3420436.1 restriction endonuclease subunit S [Salmonella enterica subsp. enterica serovar Haifa]EBY9871132.1 restriction endonuclease subunit S [Salmonella enterica subsp. enterica serova